MQLAINYSHPAAELLTAGDIHLDRFKAPDWPELVAEAQAYRPVAVHFSLDAGGPQPFEPDWAKIEQLLGATGTTYVNLHLAPFAADYPQISIDGSDRSLWEPVIERMRQHIQAVVDVFGPERVIVENVPYHGQHGKLLRLAVEPDIMVRLLQETGAYLLLDISHARIAAHYLGWDQFAYMQAMPTERLREMHFAGLHWRNGILQDHLAILEDDWPVLEWVLEQVSRGAWPRPWMLALEYGGVGEKFAWRSDPQVIARQVPRLYSLVSPI